jgi:hypothetical protein
MHKLLKCMTVVACVFATGCASWNEGAVDYRRAEPMSAPDAINDGKSSSDMVRLRYKNEPTADVRKDILKDDWIEVSLDSVFIDGILELPFTPTRGLNRQLFRPRGEIAVLAHAVELRDADVALRFGAASREEARVIFYSPDIESGQYLNINNFPVLGPIQYHGGPIYLDIFIVEMDQTSKQTEDMLGKLATAGRSVLNPADPLMSTLVDLGSSLLSSNTDDVLFHYSMVLSPSNRDSSSANPFAAVQEGRYVFISKEVREEAIDWHGLCLDHNTARLFWNPTPANLCGQSTVARRFDQDNYVVLNLRRSASRQKGSFTSETYAGLVEALKQTGQQGDGESIEAISSAVLSVVVQNAQSNNLASARGLFNDARRAVEACAKPPAGASAGQKQDLKKAADRALSDLWSQLAAGSNALVPSVLPAPPKQPIVRAADLSGLLREVAEYSNADAALIAKFSLEGFRDAYVTPANGRQEFVSQIENARDCKGT